MEIVLISGQGELPVLLATRLKSDKASFCVYSIKGFENPSLEDYKPKILEFEKLGSFLKELKRLGIKKVCFSCKVVVRGFSLDMRTPKANVGIMSGLAGRRKHNKK